MIRNSKEKALSTKQEGGIGDDKAPTSSRLWSGLRNPRIVRVSRAFGGKDRHSKVSTVRGLRDRRVRLSVPTAIQLYDLQDRLGLNQPSKVVDWLLNAAQREIDKLPPLQMPSGNFMQFPQSSVMANDATPPQSPSNPPSFKSTSYINNNGAYPFALLSSRANNGNMSDVTVAEELPTFPRTTFWNSDASQGTKQRESPKELGIEKGNLMKGNEVEDHDPLLRPGHSSVLSLLSNAYSSNLGLIRHLSQMEAYPTVIPSSLSLAPGSQSMFPSHMIASTDSDARQSSNFQTVASPSQNLPMNPMGAYLHPGCPITRSFYSNLMASKHQHSQGHHES